MARKNNDLNQLIAESNFPHDFSIHDIDGFAWWAPTKYYHDHLKKRLVLYEFKHSNESITGTQLTGYRMLANVIDWTQFDEHSGVFLIRQAKNTTDEFDVYDIRNIKEKKTTMTIDKIYEWFSNKDKCKTDWHKTSDAEQVLIDRNKDRKHFIDISKK